MRPLGVHRELRKGVWPAADDDSGVVRRALVAEERPELFPSTLRHDIPPVISQLALMGTAIEPAAGCNHGER